MIKLLINFFFENSSNDVRSTSSADIQKRSTLPSRFTLAKKSAKAMSMFTLAWLPSQPFFRPVLESPEQ